MKFEQSNSSMALNKSIRVLDRQMYMVIIDELSFKFYITFVGDNLKLDYA